MSQPGVDIKRPAFAGNSKLCALTLAEKCVTCLKDVGSFSTELQRKEYGISGMCSGCQTSFFRPRPPVDHVALMRGIHKIQERGGSAQDEDNYLRRMGFHEKHYCAIGECEPREEMTNVNEACSECLKSITENSPPSAAARKVFPPIGPRGEGPIVRKIAQLEDDDFGLDPENMIEDCEKDIENLKSHVIGYDYTGSFEGDILSSVSSRDAPFSRPKMPPDFLSHRHDMTDSERLTAWGGDFTGNCFHGDGK
jgi:hypothetical protein